MTADIPRFSKNQPDYRYVSSAKIAFHGLFGSEILRYGICRRGSLVFAKRNGTFIDDSAESHFVD